MILEGRGADLLMVETFYDLEELVDAIDGGGGVNSLVLKAATSIDLSATDQTTTDLTIVGGFQNVDASAITSGASVASTVIHRPGSEAASSR